MPMLAILLYYHGYCIVLSILNTLVARMFWLKNQQFALSLHGNIYGTKSARELFKLSKDLASH